MSETLITLSKIASVPKQDIDLWPFPGASEGFVTVLQEFERWGDFCENDLQIRRQKFDKNLNPIFPLDDLEPYKGIIVREVLSTALKYELKETEADLVAKWCVRIGSNHMKSWRDSKLRGNHRKHFSSSERMMLIAAQKALAKNNEK